MASCGVIQQSQESEGLEVVVFTANDLRALFPEEYDPHGPAISIATKARELAFAPEKVAALENLEDGLLLRREEAA